MNWQNCKNWSDRFLPQIKSIIGRNLIGEVEEDDRERNTDLIVLKLDAVRIACRVRRPGYYASYWNEFTIRTARPSGNITELQKVIRGWGDYFFYGHSDIEEANLHAWALADLKEFRLYFARQLFKYPGTCPGKFQKNRDGSSDFRAFKWSDIGDSFIVAERNIKTYRPPPARTAQ